MPEISALDAPALIDRVRKADEDALLEAYRRTFGHEMGRLVLAHHLTEMGVGGVLGTDNLKYRAGQHDAAIALASKAGFDDAALAVSQLTGELEEQDEHSMEPPAEIRDDLPD